MTKTYLITGASDGIGLATARLAAESGAAVMMVVGLPQLLPSETIEALRHIGLTLEAVSEIDAAICVGGKTPEQAAADWLKSQDVNPI